MLKQISHFIGSTFSGARSPKARIPSKPRNPTPRNSVVKALLWTAAIGSLTLTVFDGFHGNQAVAATLANQKSTHHKAVNHTAANQKSVSYKPATYKPTSYRPVSYKPASYKPVSQPSASQTLVRKTAIAVKTQSNNWQANNQQINNRQVNNRQVNNRQINNWQANNQQVNNRQANTSRPGGKRSLAAQLGGAIATNHQTYCQPSRSSIKPLCGGSGPDLDPVETPVKQDVGFHFTEFQSDPFGQAEEEILFSAKSKPIVLYQYDKTVLVQRVL